MYSIMLDFTSKEEAERYAKRLYKAERLLAIDPPAEARHYRVGVTCGALGARITGGVIENETPSEDVPDVFESLKGQHRDTANLVRKEVRDLKEDMQVEIRQAVQDVLEGQLDEPTKRRLWAVEKARGALKTTGVAAAIGGTPNTDALLRLADFYLGEDGED